MSKVLEAKLDFWAKHNLNVLLRGKHGTGKTQMVKDALEKNNIKWVYFSASTMDPWVDFVGVPKERTDSNGHSYLELIRPEIFANDEVEAIFFDELNRSPKKVRNAVMELIQFKSINGKKFKNLRFIWGAINPEAKDGEEEEYDVERLDPAQLDRFHIVIDVDNKPDRNYFMSTYGTSGGVAIDWWHSLNPESKNLVSPRRLDYALSVNKIGGDISDVLPRGINAQQLLIQLKAGSFSKKLQSLLNDDAKTTEAFKDTTFIDNVIDLILKDNKYVNYFSPFLEKERVNKLIVTNKKFRKFIIENKINQFEDNFKEIIDAKTAPNTVIKELSKYVKKTPLVPANIADTQSYIKYWKGVDQTQTPMRMKLLDQAKKLNYSTMSETELLYVFILTSVASVRTAVRGTASLDGILGKIKTRATVLNLTLVDLYETAKNDANFQGYVFTRGRHAKYWTLLQKKDA